MRKMCCNTLGRFVVTLIFRIDASSIYIVIVTSARQQ